MAVCAEYHISRLYIACLCHQLMADSVASVKIPDSIFRSKCIPHPVMADIVLLTGRNQMIIDQDHLIRIPDFRKSHLFKFFHNKGNHNIIQHHPVRMNRYDFSRPYTRSADIPGNDFFNDCLSHRASLLLSSVRFFSAWP